MAESHAPPSRNLKDNWKVPNITCTSTFHGPSGIPERFVIKTYIAEEPARDGTVAYYVCQNCYQKAQVHPPKWDKKLPSYGMLLYNSHKEAYNSCYSTFSAPELRLERCDACGDGQRRSLRSDLPPRLSKPHDSGRGPAPRYHVGGV